MKAIFITYNQSHTAAVDQILEKNHIRGYPKWPLPHGRGTDTGEPHLASHTWPAMNSSILTIVEDHKVAPILRELHEEDTAHPKHGLRAFVWNIEEQI